MTAFFTWLLTTKVGRAVAATTLVAITLVTSWYFFSSHYEKVGYDKCQTEHALAVANQNVEVVDGQNKRDKKTDAISDAARKEGSAATAKVDATTNETKEIANVVYRDPPKTAPVAPGSCVHPLDGRLQERIERAVDQANRP